MKNNRFTVMTKKIYQKPTTKVCQIHVRKFLLQSGGGEPGGGGGAGARRRSSSFEDDEEY